MTETIIAASAGIIGTLAGGWVSYLTQRARLKNELETFALKFKMAFF
ncbi:MAG: hypothetical protein MK076_00010 [Flavobacteriales bacterium]|nr:hypothetical protein [Flavobacteriales bacterium]